MPSPVRLIGQAVFFAAAAALTGYLSSQPTYHETPPGMARIKLSLVHGARRVEDCRRLTAKEIAALPANERRPNTCARERRVVHVALEIDGTLVHDAILEPTGLSGDGPARIYQSLEVPAGRHVIVARLADSGRAEGFDYETTQEVDLAPWQNLAIDFRADKGGFAFR